MAPNQKFRKNSSNTADDASLWAVQSKVFLPLTDPSFDATSTANVIEQDVDTVKVVQEALPQKDLGSHDAYWHWPTLTSDTVTYKTHKTVADANSNSNKVDLFSAAFIESRLLAESQRLQERLQNGVTIIRAPPRSSEEDAYWDERRMTVTSEANRALSDGTGYWDWSTVINNGHARLIQLPRKDEIVRQKVGTVADATSRLVHDLRDISLSEGEPPSKIRRAGRGSKEDEAYWLWDSSPRTTVYAKPDTIDDLYWEWNTDPFVKSVSAAKIDDILEHDATWELFSIQHVTKTLVQAASVQDKAGSKRIVASANDADHYWTWSSA